MTAEGAAAVPVTVIGGYLGAGKTTLLNHLLTNATERLTVLVNDFGEINIDAGLVESHDGDTITLANGCICCSMVDGLAAALDAVLAMAPPPERLVIEASGVADPGTVAGFCHGPGLLLDAVVVVVDVDTVRSKVADPYVGDMVVAQLRAADIAVVNKLDLVDAANAAAVVAWLDRFSPGALRLPVRHARVAPELLFGRNASGDPGPDADPDPDTDGHSASGDSNAGGVLRADERFESWTWSSVDPLDRAAIERLMDRVPEEVWRLKGIVRLTDDTRRPWVLQRVGRRWSLRPIAGRAANDVTTSTLVAIGRPGAIDDGWLGDQLR